MAEHEHRVVFDVELCRPACVILQAVFGGDVAAASRFPSTTWLIGPTGGMRLYRVTDEELDRLVTVVVADHREGEQ